MTVCVLSVGGYTVGPTEPKFGMEDHIYPWEVLRYISFRCPYPGVGGGQRVVLEVCAAQMVHFCENFIKQKLKGTPANGGTGQVRPHPGVRQLVQVQGELVQPWSHGHFG